MASIKPTIFISHIHEDSQIAHCLKQFLDEAFLGSFNIFVSSDGASIRAGDNWSAAIEHALSEADIVFALISEKAKERRWIYFECGGAYFAQKRVVPICCRNFPISHLNPPLSWLQAINGADLGSVMQLIDVIAHTFDMRKPKYEVAQLSGYLTGSPCDSPVGIPEPAKTNQRAFPLFLVIDTSGSMTGEPIERLTTSIKKMLEDLIQSPSSNIAPLISIISFGDEAREVISLSPLSPDTLDFRLVASGATSLGSALQLLASRLADDSRFPPRYLSPMIMIFTDGEPTDDWYHGLNALNQSKYGKNARRICVAWGDDVNFDVLTAIAGKSVISIPDINNISGLSSMFTWVSSSVRTLSKEETDENFRSLPPLPFSNWESLD